MSEFVVSSDIASDPVVSSRIMSKFVISSDIASGSVDPSVTMSGSVELSGILSAASSPPLAAFRFLTAMTMSEPAAPSTAEKRKSTSVFCHPSSSPSTK